MTRIVFHKQERVFLKELCLANHNWGLTKNLSRNMNNTYQTITNAITHQPSKESFVNKDYNVDLLIDHTINPKL